MGRRWFSSDCLAAVILSACVIVSTVRASAPCTDCASTAFPTPATATLCDSVQLSVTGRTSGPLEGGDIYSFSTDLGHAAVHAGLLASGATANLYVFFAGQRPVFFASTKNGATSAASTTAAYGYLLSTTNTCPSFSATSTPISDLPDVAPATIYGTTYYRFDSLLNTAALHMGLLPSGGSLSGTWYAHHVADDHVAFLRTTLNGLTSSASTGPSVAFSISAGLVLAPTYHPNITRVPVVPDSHSTGSTFYGVGFYRFGDLVNNMIVHSNAFSPQEAGTAYLHYVGHYSHFYRANQAGLTSASTDLAIAEPAFAVSRSADPIVPPSPNVTIASVAVEEFLTSTLYGATWYRGDSYIEDVVFHADLVGVDQRKTVYLHEIGKRDVFYSMEWRGMKSSASLTYDFAFVPSLSPEPPTDEFIRKVRVRFTRSNSIWGSGYYRWDSELATVAFHAGLVNVGDIATLYLHDLAMKQPFYRTSNRGIMSSPDYDSERALALSESPDYPVEFDAFPIPVRVMPSTHSGLASAWGTGVYRRDSDITRAAIHMGFAQLDQHRTVWVHPVGSHSVFYGAHMNGVATSYTASGTDPAFALTDTYMPQLTIPDIATNAYTTNISVVDFQSAGTNRGLGLFGYWMDVKMAAVMEGLVTTGDRKEITIHPVPSPPHGVPGGCFFHFCTSGYESVPHAFAVSLAGDPSPQQGLPAGTVKASVVLKQESDGSGEGFGGTGYRLSATSMTRAATQLKLLPVFTRGDIYIHFKGTSNIFFGADVNGIITSSYYHSTNQYQLVLVTTSATPPSFDVNHREFNACFDYYPYNPTVTGAHVYRFNSDVVIAAAHDYLLPFDTCKTLYLHPIGSFPWFYEATRGALKSSYDDAAGQAYIITPTAVAPTVPTANPMPITLDASMVDTSSIYGHGVYHMASDLQRVAGHMGLLQWNEVTPKTIYVHRLGSRNWFPQSSHNGVVAEDWESGTAGTAIHLSLSATPPSIAATVYPLTVTHSLDAACASAALTGFHVWKYTSDVVCAAALERLIAPGETKTIYAHDVGTQPWFPGVTYDNIGTSQSNAAGRAFKVSLSATPPAAVTAPYAITVNVTDVPVDGSVVGYQLYDEDSNMLSAAYQMGLIKVGVESTFYVHKMPGTYNRFFSCTQNGIKSTGSISTDGATPPAPGSHLHVRGPA